MLVNFLAVILEVCVLLLCPRNKSDLPVTRTLLLNEPKPVDTAAVAVTGNLEDTAKTVLLFPADVAFKDIIVDLRPVSFCIDTVPPKSPVKP